VVVAVDEQRDAVGPLAEEPRGAAVDEPGVERHGREGRVVPVRVRVGDQLRVGDVPVARPVQVRVVDQERGP
jgi:hypothetical protein